MHPAEGVPVVTHPVVHLEQLQVLLGPLIGLLEYLPASEYLTLGALQLHGLLVEPLLYLDLLGVVGPGGDTVVAQHLLDLQQLALVSLLQTLLPQLDH